MPDDRTDRGTAAYEADTLPTKLPHPVAGFLDASFGQKLYEVSDYHNDPNFFGQIGLGKQCRPRSDCS